MLSRSGISFALLTASPTIAMAEDGTRLHPVMLWGFGLVAVVLFFSLWASWQGRKTVKSGSQQQQQHWWALLGIGVILTVILGAPLLEQLRHPSSNEAALLVRCTASQWKWQYQYESYEHQPIAGIAFVSAMQTPADISPADLANQLFGNAAPPIAADELLEVDHPLILPAGKRVRFTITSEDSIHSWWIPRFNLKKDAIPGFEQAVDVQLPAQEGIYRGMCSQLCGQQHAFMPIVVRLVSQADFRQWLAEAPKTLQAQQRKVIPDSLPMGVLLDLGSRVYQARCALCHGDTGTGRTGWFPALMDSPSLKGSSEELLALLSRGKGVMPGMQGILARDEMAGLLSLLRQRFGGIPPEHAAIQPSDLKDMF